MQPKRSLLIASCGALVATAGVDTQAAVTPTFTSGPAIASADANSYPDGTTFVFGYQSVSGFPNGSLKALGQGQTGGPWTMWNGNDHFKISGGYDGDPAASYIPPTNSRIMNCGHAAVSPGYIYCGRAIPPQLPGDHYQIEGSVFPNPVGSATFPAGASPVLVARRSNFGQYFVDMFARRSDNQIWSTNYGVASQSWGNWSQVPGPPGDSFTSDPGATTYTASGDLVMVCARLSSSAQIACSQQVYGMGGSVVWTSWTAVSVLPGTFFKPALARDFNSVLLFGRQIDPNFADLFTSSPVGGGSWGSYSAVSNLIGLRSGPAAVANATSGSPRAMTAAKGSDFAFWFSAGAPDAFNGLMWNNWIQIQVTQQR